MRYEYLPNYYSEIDYSELSMETIYDYMAQYFEDVLELLKTTPIDIAAHITCPVRYICGKYKRDFDVHRFDDRIAEILRYLIAHDIALEVNASGIAQYGFYMPDIAILKMYREMGGYLITTASDAHTPAGASLGFDTLYQTLYELGFRNVYYYENRVPIPCRIRAEER